MRKSRRQFPGATPYKDRHGVRRWRYRRNGFSAELGTEYGSAEFVARYEAAQHLQKDAGRIGRRCWQTNSNQSPNRPKRPASGRAELPPLFESGGSVELEIAS